MKWPGRLGTPLKQAGYEGRRGGGGVAGDVAEVGDGGVGLGRLLLDCMVSWARVTVAFGLSAGGQHGFLTHRNI